MVYTVTFNPALDYTLHIDEPSGENITRAKSAEIRCGGKGINVSLVLNSLDIKNIALGFVGGFTGEKLEEMLKTQGVDCDFVHISGDTRINVKIKVGSEFDINADGPDIKVTETDALTGKISEIRSGDVLILSGSAPKSVPSDIYEKILRICQNRDVMCVVDAVGDLLGKSLKFHPFLVKPNHIELGDFFGVSINGVSGIIKYAKKLQELGAENVLVSCGEDGAVLILDTGEVLIRKNAEGEALDTVGCGDSMVSFPA